MRRWSGRHEALVLFNLGVEAWKAPVVGREWTLLLDASGGTSGSSATVSGRSFKVFAREAKP